MHLVSYHVTFIYVVIYNQSKVIFYKVRINHYKTWYIDVLFMLIAILIIVNYS